MEEFYVDIIETDTGRIEKTVGPLSENRAYKVDDGININLNHELFHTQIRDESIATFFTPQDSFIVNRGES